MTEAGVQLAQADIRDAQTICNLGIRTFHETFAAHNTAENMAAYLNDAFALSTIEAELKTHGTIYLLATIDNAEVGFAKLRTGKTPTTLQESNAIELQRLYVLKDYIGKGIGRVLLNHCIRLAQADNFDVLWLGVWEHNLHAQKFYQNFGFERFSEHIFQLGTDPQTDFLMRKNLST